MSSATFDDVLRSESGSQKTLPARERAARAVRGRIVACDRIRGLAVVIMIVAHVVAMLDCCYVFQATFGRAVLPLFMAVTGWLLQDRDRPSWQRVGQLIVAAAAALWFVEAMPYMARMNILAVIVLALAVWPLARRWPVAGLVVCFVSMGLMPQPWDGHHLGEAVGLMICGRWALAEGSALRRVGDRLPEWFGFVGRWPLVIYFIHLVALWWITPYFWPS